MKLEFCLASLELLFDKSSTQSEVHAHWANSHRNSERREMSSKSFHKMIETIERFLPLMVKCTRLGAQSFYTLQHHREHVPGDLVLRCVAFQRASMLASSKITLREVVSAPPSRSLLIAADLIPACGKGNTVTMRVCDGLSPERTVSMHPLSLLERNGSWYLLAEHTESLQQEVIRLAYATDARVGAPGIRASKSVRDGAIPLHYFEGCCGGDTSGELIELELRATPNEALLLHDQPIHHTQERFEVKATHTDFKMQVRLNDDLLAALHARQGGIAILSPLGLQEQLEAYGREQTARKAQETAALLAL